MHMANPILLYGVIYSASAKEFTEKVLAVPKGNAVDIWMNSPGGNPDAGWSMLAAMQERETVNMTVMGDASSMAFYMLLFASKVIAYDTAKLLVHRAAAFEEEELSPDQLQAVISQNNTIREKMEARINEAKFIEITGVTFDQIFSMKTRIDVTLTAQQGKDIGLVDEVVNLDVRKREEIESYYFSQIAALATTKKTNSNNNNSDMGLFSKDPIFVGMIGESQFAYSKLEVSAKIKVTGGGERDSLTGTFEANDKKVTVVNNEITAIEDVDKKKEQIEALRVEMTEVKAQLIEALEKPKEEKPKEGDDIESLKVEMLEMKEIIAKAKLSVSNPLLPKGEFNEQNPIKPVIGKKKEREIQASVNDKAGAVKEAVDNALKNRRL